MPAQKLEDAFRDPPREFSLLPLWFWNDALTEAELLRQMDDFEAHGVYGFVIHPRVGLPRDIGWLSGRMLHFMRFTIDEAKRRKMPVMLFDEGMYSSGSSSGQVVAENPAYACRCLAKVNLARGETAPALLDDEKLVAIIDRPDGGKAAVIDRKANTCIRGIHFIDEGPAEDEPPATDLFNPDAVACFIRLVYDTYYRHFGHEFGKTIIGIFNDEPGALGRPREAGIWAGNSKVLPHVEQLLGYDFTPHLAKLWYDLPDAPRYREQYTWAVERRLHETFFGQLGAWCRAHGVALCGHPANGQNIGPQRHYDIPGQDLVWRWVDPHKPSALEGAESTQAKCSSSAMIHLGRRRNANECFGAYGHSLTHNETKWLVDWCFIRGVNMLYPHGFYYSVRGARFDERPPDVGPNSAWWPGYKHFADYCRRMCWLNTDCTHVCDVAILGQDDHLPWRAAKVLFQNQIDFNYLEARHLWEDAEVTSDGIRIAGMHYRALIVERPIYLPAEAEAPLARLATAGRVAPYSADADPAELLAGVRRLAAADVLLDTPQPDLRVRHVIKDGRHFYMMCNEGTATIRAEVKVAARGPWEWLDPMTGERTGASGQPARLTLDPYTVLVLSSSPGGCAQ
jgi:hypothetical protein